VNEIELRERRVADQVVRREDNAFAQRLLHLVAVRPPREETLEPLRTDARHLLLRVESRTATSSDVLVDVGRENLHVRRTPARAELLVQAASRSNRLPGRSRIRPPRHESARSSWSPRRSTISGITRRSSRSKDSSSRKKRVTPMSRSSYSEFSSRGVAPQADRRRCRLSSDWFQRQPPLDPPRHRAGLVV